MKYTATTIIGILIVVIGGFLLLQSSSDEKGDASSEDTPQSKTQTQQNNAQNTIPDFAFENLEGGTVTPADFEGKVLVVNSWAVWCPFCRNELPDLAKLQEEFKDEIAVIAIDRAESKEKQLDFLGQIEVKNELVFLLDPNDTFYRSIGGFTMPETLFVKPNGEIVTHKRGFMDIDEMREKVSSLLPE